MPLSEQELLDRFNRRRAPTSVVFNGIVTQVDAAEGRVRLQYDVGPEFCNPMGNVQGGIVTALMDDACAFACIAKSGERIFVPTLELKTTFLGPAKKGRLYAEARCIKFGRTIAFMEAELTDEAGTILAKMSTTTAPRKLEQAPVLVETESTPN